MKQLISLAAGLLLLAVPGAAALPAQSGMPSPVEMPAPRRKAHRPSRCRPPRSTACLHWNYPVRPLLFRRWCFHKTGFSLPSAPAACAAAPWGGTRSAYPLGRTGGSRKGTPTFARAARPEGRGGDSQEAGGTLVPPPLVCLRRTAASFSGRALCAPTTG